MNVPAQQQSDAFGQEKFTVPAGATDLTTFSTYAGSAASTAMDSALQMQGCRWPLHFEGDLVEYVVELGSAERDALIVALRNDAGVAETPIGQVTAFSYTIPKEGPLGNPINITYAFIENVWIALFERAGGYDFVASALDGLYAANPSLITE